MTTNFTYRTPPRNPRHTISSSAFSPSGMFYNPMTLLLPAPSTDLKEPLNISSMLISGQGASIRSRKERRKSPRVKTHYEKRKRLRTRALLIPLLTTVQDLWGQLARCSFEFLMHSPKCRGMAPAEVLALSSERLLSIERCVQSLLLATRAFAKNSSTKMNFGTSEDPHGTKEPPHTTRASVEKVGRSSWSKSVSSLLSLLPLSGREAMGKPSISVNRPMSPIRSDPISATHGTPTFGKVKGDLKISLCPFSSSWWDKFTCLPLKW